MGQDDLSDDDDDDDDELSDEDCDMEDLQPGEPSAFSPHNSSASHASPKRDGHSQPSPSGGDLLHARVFKFDDRDESRYFGMLPL